MRWRPWRDGITRITLVPLFLAQGGHLKEDLPRFWTTSAAATPALTDRRYPGIRRSAVLTAAIAGLGSGPLCPSDLTPSHPQAGKKTARPEYQKPLKFRLLD